MKSIRTAVVVVVCSGALAFAQMGGGSSGEGATGSDPAQQGTLGQHGGEGQEHEEGEPKAEEQQEHQKGTGGAGQAGQSMGVELPKDAKGFAERLHHDNQMEVKLGQLAQQKGTSESVKRYGQMMVTDHQQLDQQLTSMAQQNKWKLSDKPSKLNDQEKKVMEADKAVEGKLETLSGLAWDLAYMTHMLADHNMTLLRLQAAQQQFASDKALSSLVQQATPKITQHRDEAYRILGELNRSSTGVGGAGMEGMEGMEGMDTGMGGTGMDDSDANAEDTDSRTRPEEQKPDREY